MWCSLSSPPELVSVLMILLISTIIAAFDKTDNEQSEFPRASPVSLRNWTDVFSFGMHGTLLPGVVLSVAGPKRAKILTNYINVTKSFISKCSP